MELDTTANYLLVQFKEEGDEEWGFDVWQHEESHDTLTFMVYPTEADAMPDMDWHERAGHKVRLISIHGTEAERIGGNQQFVIHGNTSRLYRFQDVR
ncbi:MAG TPA: hypothetical protein VG826_02660 [Pirellulales bacterium]|nr:hypothetical protein [Pirellulales bacterium]